jgi:hypothetical protein
MIKNTMQAHKVFFALDQEYRTKNWIGQDPLLSRQVQLSQEILVVYALRKVDGRHVLYIQCDPDDAARGHKYPEWKGISIQYSGFENPGIGGCFIRIEQAEGNDDDIYFAVADDLCSCLNGVLRVNLRKSLSLTLERWQRFFSLREKIRLTKEEQVGLFGELWLLREMLNHDLGFPAIGYWKGPYREVFDYSMQNMSIEVKSTSTKMPYKAYINNEVQLDDGLAGGTLILCFVAVQTNESSGETLADIVQFIEEFVKSDEAAYRLFQDKIFGCGLGSAYINSYIMHYIIKEQAFFNVEEGFPRILKRNLQNGLGEISYSLDISACGKYKIGENDFWRIAKLHAKKVGA